MTKIGTIQIGKQGVTNNFIETLKNHFIKHENVKISVLKNATRDKEELKEFTQRILDGLGTKYTARVIGFTIVVKKWRKNIR
jgi:RNA-binding protein YhbY